MKHETLLIAAGLGLVGMLFLKSQKSSTPTGVAGIGATSGAGGPPSWASYAGPMGAKYNPLTGTMEIQPLPVQY